MPDTAAIKTASRYLVDQLGGLDAAETACRAGRSVLGDYINRNSPRIMALDVALQLDRCAQEPVMLSTLARLEGYTIMSIELGEGDVAQSMEHVARGAGDLMTTTVRALADGHVDAQEAAELSHRLTDLHRAVTHALGVLKQHQQQKPVVVGGADAA